MTVNEAQRICDQVTLTDCIFEENTTCIIGIKDGHSIQFDKFKEAWARLERFYGKRWRGKGLLK